MERVPLCHQDGASLNLNAGPSRSAQQYLSVYFTADPRFSPCQHRAPPPSSRPDGPIPTLLPPPGAQVRGSGVSSGGDRADAHAVILSDLAAEALLRHYGAQLRERGWKPGSEHTGSELAVQTWEMNDSDGALWHGVLVATRRPSPRGRDVFLRVVRVTPE